MEEISELAQRAEILRARFEAFLDDLGQFPPRFSDIRSDLAEIDEHLEALRQREG